MKRRSTSPKADKTRTVWGAFDEPRKGWPGGQPRTSPRTRGSALLWLPLCLFLGMPPMLAQSLPSNTPLAFEVASVMTASEGINGVKAIPPRRRFHIYSQPKGGCALARPMRDHERAAQPFD